MIEQLGAADCLGDAIKELLLFQQSQGFDMNMAAVLKQINPGIAVKVGPMDGVPELEQFLFVGDVLLQMNEGFDGGCHQ